MGDKDSALDVLMSIVQFSAQLAWIVGHRHRIFGQNAGKCDFFPFSAERQRIVCLASHRTASSSPRRIEV